MNTKYEDYAKAIKDLLFKLLQDANVDKEAIALCLCMNMTRNGIENGYSAGQSVNEIAYRLAYEIVSASHRSLLNK